MVETRSKVGIISCSGEEIPEGTISRLAVRRVLEALRPGRTVTLCLPLFLAGGEEERAFARNHPTIAVDGCDKLCAKRGTETHSGPVSASLVVSDLLDGKTAGCSRSARNLSEPDAEAVWIVAEKIASEVDTLLERQPEEGPNSSSGVDAGCACSRPLPGLALTVCGKSVPIDGLSLIFDQLAGEGVAGDDTDTDRILDRVKIYHSVPETEENEYRGVLLNAYREYRRKR